MTSSSACRRRSAADRASRAGRQWSVGGSDAALGEQVLHPKAGPGAGQPRRDRARRGSPVGGEGGGVPALDLVLEEDLPVRLRQPAQGEVDHGGLRLADRLVLRAQLRVVRPGEQVCALPGPLLTLEPGRDEVARGGDRIGGERVALHP